MSTVKFRNRIYFLSDRNEAARLLQNSRYITELVKTAVVATAGSTKNKMFQLIPAQSADSEFVFIPFGYKHEDELVKHIHRLLAERRLTHTEKKAHSEPTDSAVSYESLEYFVEWFNNTVNAAAIEEMRKKLEPHKSWWKRMLNKLIYNVEKQTHK